MLTPSTLVLFCSTAIVLVITPGPNTLYVVTRSFAGNKRAGVVSALGIGIGNLFHTLAAAVGLSALIMSSALAYQVVKYAGAAYLIYLGIQTLFHQTTLQLPRSADLVSMRQTFIQAILTAILNPKVALFYLAFLPQFIDPAVGKIYWQIAILGSIHSLMTTLWYTLVARLTNYLEHWFHMRSSFARLRHWVTGTVLIALGIRVALSERT